LSEQYFSRRPRAAPRPREFRAVLRGRALTFRTDSAVFSRTQVDRGTELLIDTLDVRPGESLLDHLDTTRYTLLPNTAGCYTADEAVRTAYLAREAGLGEMVKLEVIGDSRTLFPDVEGLLEATRTLARDGFVVMPYTNDDPVTAKKLEDAGAACVMPLGAPIGSGLGIRNPYNIKIILETVTVPVIVDAGVGTASDATVAMELGADGVLMNTAIAQAEDAVLMARAMKNAVEAGRQAYLAGRIAKKLYASASSPADGLVR